MYSTGKSRSFSNDDAGIAKTMLWLKQVNQAIVVMEPTDDIEVSPYIVLQKAKLPAAVINSGQIRDLARSMGNTG